MADNILEIKPVLKGWVEEQPSYREQEMEDYTGNPFIEALPDIFDDETIIDKFTINPIFKNEERDKSTNIRFHMIKRLKSFVQPLDIHFTIERKLSAIIRRGYLARNPVKHDYLNRFKLLNDVKNENDSNKVEKFNQLSESLRSTADSFSIIGISGIGKSTAIERLLLMYPQVINHFEYMGKPFTRTQIVWLKIDCPYDGSLKTLCKIFFKAVDDVLGTTNYFKKYGDNRNSAATMMIHMTYIASIHSIGVLVIDEIQHLLNPKNPPEEMLNFFVTLVNTIGIPTIMVGTPSAKKVLTKEFRQSRRAEADGSISWDRMKKDEVWDFFLESMWEYQWLKEYTPLTEELNNIMYDNSQGITSLVVILFMLAQERALASGIEKITSSLIKEVMENDLNLVKDIIKALKKNDIVRIASYDDITIDMEYLLENINRDIEVRERVTKQADIQKLSRKIKGSNIKEQLLTEIITLGMLKNLDYNDIEEIIDSTIKQLGVNEDIADIKQHTLRACFVKEDAIAAKKEKIKESKKRPKSYDDEDLRSIYDQAKNAKKQVYELLKRKGYIGDPLEEFY